MQRQLGTILALFLTVFAGSLGPGCSGGSSSSDQRARVVQPSQFRDGDFSETDRQPRPRPAVPAVEAIPAAEAGPAVVRVEDFGPDDIVVEIGSPEFSGAIESAPSPRLSSAPIADEQSDDANSFVVDKMVGQINGKPVFASEFFREMDARMRREAARQEPRDFLRFAEKEVVEALRDRLRDELLLAEFYAGLKPEQRAGLQYFIQNMRETIVSGLGGADDVVSQRLQEQEGLTIDEAVKRRADRAFIGEQIRNRIAGSVHVSTREVERFYNQNIDEFQPPPIAHFRIIRISEGNADAIARVQEMLDRGISFQQVAAAESTWRTRDQNMHTQVIESREYSKTVFWGPEELNRATQTLMPGERAGPVAAAGSLWWIMLERIEIPEGKSLYEVQLDIEQQLRNEKLKKEEYEYFEMLLSRSTYSDFQVMVRRLLEYAAERYLVQTSAVEIPPVTADEQDDDAGSSGQ